jgi:hypothetical protein
VVEDVTVVGRRVADLSVEGFGLEGFELAVLEETGAGAPEKIDVAFDSCRDRRL